jgi:uncharacterized membrane protein
MTEKDTVTVSESNTATQTAGSRCALRARLKSWAVWLAILGAVGIILGATGVLAKWGLDESGWDNIVTAIGSVLVGFGILNNPTDSKSF